MLASRVICGYRTISYETSILLARIMPYEIRAKRLANLYWSIKASRDAGIVVTFRDKRLLVLQSDAVTLAEWAKRVAGLSGRRVRKAIGPRLAEWFEREHGSYSFRTIQLISGHRCFNDLFRINRAPSPLCSQCGDAWDSVDHTIKECTYLAFF